jgi:hypothetical protein
MAKYFRIDGKVARAAIAEGEYKDFYWYLEMFPIEKQFMYLIAVLMNY